MADLVITAANVDYISGGSKATVDAGETLTAGQPIYILSTDGKAYKADANASATTAKAVGIALNGATLNQPVTYAKPGATINPGATVAVGSWYVVSATAGGIAPIADQATGWRPNLVGYATAADRLVLMMTNTNVAVP